MHLFTCIHVKFSLYFLTNTFLSLSLSPTSKKVVYAEILDSLRYTRPVTKQTLNTVLHHLNSLPPGSLRSLTLSLSFFDMNEGRKQFPLFLHRSTSLKLVRFGDVYLWIEPIASNNAHDTEASATATTAPTSLKDSSGAAAAATSGGGEEDSVDARLGHFTIPYWLILTHQMQEDTVTALLYSYSLPHAEKTPIFKQVFVCERFFVLLVVRIFLACMCARSCDISSARVLAYRLRYGALIFVCT